MEDLHQSFEKEYKVFYRLADQFLGHTMLMDSSGWYPLGNDAAIALRDMLDLWLKVPDELKQEYISRLKSKENPWGTIYSHSRKARNTPEPRKGFVYLMKNNRNGFSKIGFSKEPKFREKTLQSEEPEVELVHCWPATIRDEEKLHKTFSDRRVRGEWFNLQPNAIHEIEFYFAPLPVI